METHQQTARDTELREILINQRRRVHEALRETVNLEREAGASRALQVDDAPEMSDANLTSAIDFSLAQMRSETLANIDAALKRLDAGRYGQCIDCDVDIPAKRLAAIPFATRCRDCAEDQERLVSRPAPMVWERTI